eukprot:472462-Pelagomonas_calceolata.AAC.1
MFEQQRRCRAQVQLFLEVLSNGAVCAAGPQAFWKNKLFPLKCIIEVCKGAVCAAAKFCALFNGPTEEDCLCGNVRDTEK